MRKSKYKFIFQDGVLGWGISTGFILFLYNWFVNYERSWSDFIGTMVTFLIGGYFWGLAMWKFYKWRDKRAKK